MLSVRFTLLDYTLKMHEYARLCTLYADRFSMPSCIALSCMISLSWGMEKNEFSVTAKKEEMNGELLRYTSQV